MKYVIAITMILLSTAAMADNTIAVRVAKDAKGQRQIIVTETNSGNVKQVQLRYKNEVLGVSESLADKYLTMSLGNLDFGTEEIPANCRVLQFGQSSLSPNSKAISLGIYVDGNDCEKVVKRLLTKSFAVIFTEARSGVGENMAPTKMTVQF